MHHILKQHKQGIPIHKSHLYHERERSPVQPVISEKADKTFPYQATKYFTSLIDSADPDDPLLKQILPVEDEMVTAPGYSKDPLDELKYQPVPGLLHKYEGRALLITTGKCAIHCRYCFRRHFPYTETDPAHPEWNQALEYTVPARGRESVPPATFM